MQFLDCKFDETKDYLKILQESKALLKFIVCFFFLIYLVAVGLSCSRWNQVL